MGTMTRPQPERKPPEAVVSVWRIFHAVPAVAGALITGAALLAAWVVLRGRRVRAERADAEVAAILRAWAADTDSRWP